MSKYSLITLALVGCISIVSCKKEYTCTCTATYNGQSLATSTNTITNSKKKATSSCTEQQTTKNYGGVDVTSTCTLK